MEKELKSWHDEKKVTRTIKNLQKNLFETMYVETGKQAFEHIMKMVSKDICIGMGDSYTLQEIGVIKELKSKGYNLLDPWEKGITREESLARRRKALTSDIFLTGTNALTMDGKLVSTDGLGNRVAGMIFGPLKVIVVAGVNKIVANVEEAIARIRNIAAPVNARKHDYKPPLRSPCADTGFCSDCSARQSMCNKTVIIEGCSRDQGRMTVMIIGEELGY